MYCCKSLNGQQSSSGRKVAIQPAEVHADHSKQSTGLATLIEWAQEDWVNKQDDDKGIYSTPRLVFQKLKAASRLSGA
jgi:hypothetical protein